MLIDKCPVTIFNRKYYPFHSVFDVRGFAAQVDAVFLHSNKTAQKTSVYYDNVTKVISADMPPADYDAFWTRLWRQKLPALRVNADRSDSDPIFQTVDLGERK